MSRRPRQVRAKYSLLPWQSLSKRRATFPQIGRWLWNTQITMFVLATRLRLFDTSDDSEGYQIAIRPRRSPGVLRIPSSARCWSGESPNQIGQTNAPIGIAKLSLMNCGRRKQSGQQYPSTPRRRLRWIH